MDQLKIEYQKVSDLIPYAKNPRKNREAVNYVANSIKEFGFKNPIIIDGNNEIIAGHTRLLAAKKLGIEEVPCIRANDLSEEQIKAFRLADNKTGEFAEWDNVLLDEELQGILEIDMEALGFFFEDEKEKKGKASEEGEVPFSEELMLTHNYIVLYFDNDFDWEVAQEKFGLKQVRDLIPRKSQPTGIGRVISGKRILEWKEN